MYRLGASVTVLYSYSISALQARFQQKGFTLVFQEGIHTQHSAFKKPNRKILTWHLTSRPNLCQAAKHESTLQQPSVVTERAPLCAGTTDLEVSPTTVHHCLLHVAMMPFLNCETSTLLLDGADVEHQELPAN